jgi:hypothetical protein
MSRRKGEYPEWGGFLVPLAASVSMLLVEGKEDPAAELSRIEERSIWNSLRKAGNPCTVRWDGLKGYGGYRARCEKQMGGIFSHVENNWGYGGTDCIAWGPLGFLSQWLGGTI